MSGKAAFIGIDWGTSNLRAAVLDGDGAVLRAVARPLGVLAVAAGRFEAVFEDVVGPWLGEFAACPVVACGMVGSRQGWCEAPYLPCPCDESALAAGLVHPPGRYAGRVSIVPGAMVAGVGRAPDVMRGEEVQVFGALAPDAEDAVVCLPGTHSKWVVVRARSIEYFATHMTGEVFELLGRHSILAKLMEGEAFDATGFRAGLARAREPGGLLHHLFSVRALNLVGRLPGTALHAFLSGVLLGHEVAAGLVMSGSPLEVVLAGRPELCRLYREALVDRDVAAVVADDGASFRGLARVARRAGLIS